MTRNVSQPETKSTTAALTFRPGDSSDSYLVFQIFEETLADLSRRLGSATPTSWQDPAALARTWEQRRPLYEHLARTAEHFWIAEHNGRPIGFARSVLRDGVRQLSELFVIPEVQSTGAGRELLARVFPPDGAAYRSIMATTDIRAQALYLKAGVYPRCPIYYFGCMPERVTVETDLKIEPISTSLEILEMLGALDTALLGYRRDLDHSWFISNRQGYLYLRDDRPVGYGYIGANSGPFALLNAGDFPAILAHAETEAADHDRPFGVEVPMVNRTAVDYLLSRGFRLDSFVAILMNDRPFGRFENYIICSPPFFL
jgi:GNAT superfamily N-acetyltransferase